LVSFLFNPEDAGDIILHNIAVVHFVELMGLGMPRLALSNRFLSQGIQVALETRSRIELRNLSHRGQLAGDE
jgi:hypothetical protein